MNSDKQFREQIRIVSEVMYSRNYNPDLKRLVKGVMIESYLVEGRISVKIWYMGSRLPIEQDRGTPGKKGKKGGSVKSVDFCKKLSIIRRGYTK